MINKFLSKVQFAVLAVFILLFFINGCKDKASTGTETPDSGQPESISKPGRRKSPLPDSLDFTAIRSFAWGDNLDSVLRSMGVAPSDANAAQFLLRRTTDLRQIPIETEAKVVLSDSGLVRLVIEPPRSVMKYRVDRTASHTFTAYVDTMPSDTFLVRYNGTVERSFYESIMEADGTPELAVKFISIFQFVHYFSSETRVGDKYDMIVERVYVNDQPFGFGSIKAAQYIQGEDTLTGVWRSDSTMEYGGEYFNEEGLSLRRDLLRAPFPAARVTSTYGLRKHPISGDVKKHHGVDFGAAMGTPIVASGDGIITKLVRGDKGLGNWMHIKHIGTGFETRYGHMSKFAKGMKVGLKVKQNQVIGYVGMTGFATGPHLHYETFRDGQRVNPLKLKGSPVQKLSEEQMQEFLSGEYRKWRLALEQSGAVALDKGLLGPLAN